MQHRHIKCTASHNGEAQKEALRWEKAQLAADNEEEQPPAKKQVPQGADESKAKEEAKDAQDLDVSEEEVEDEEASDGRDDLKKAQGQDAVLAVVAWDHEMPTKAQEWQLAKETFPPVPGKVLQADHIPRDRVINLFDVNGHKVCHANMCTKFAMLTQVRHNNKNWSSLLVPLKTVVQKSVDRHEVWKMSQMKLKIGSTFAWRHWIRHEPKLSSNPDHLQDTKAFYLTHFDDDNADSVNQAIGAKHACTLQVVKIEVSKTTMMSSVTCHFLSQKKTAVAVIDWLATTKGSASDANSKQYLGKGLAQFLLNFIQTMSLQAIRSQLVFLHCAKAARNVCESMGFVNVSDQFNQPTDSLPEPVATLHCDWKWEDLKVHPKDFLIGWQ